MKPTEFCNCISCADCEYYSECSESMLEVERAKGKFSSGKLKVGRFSRRNDDLKD